MILVKCNNDICKFNEDGFCEKELLIIEASEYHGECQSFELLEDLEEE